MFRLAVADVESGVISINVSALSKHQFGKSLHASLEAFVEGNPIDYIHRMSRIDDSVERAFNIVYYSNLLHELRHFFDSLLTPYGAFAIRNAYYNYQLILGVAAQGAPMIVPFVLGSDPFIVKHELGLDGDEATRIIACGRVIRAHQQILEKQNSRYELPNGKNMYLGGSAMLEALAFGFQQTFLNFPTLKGPHLERLFPGAFSDYGSHDPSGIDVIYRWFAPFQQMIGTDPNAGVAKIVTALIFASLCGAYRSGTQKTFKRELSEVETLPVFNLGRELPSKLFERLLRTIIDQFDSKPVDPDLSWDTAWEIVDRALERECGRGMLASIRFDIEQDEKFAESIDPTALRVGGIAVDHLHLWFKSFVKMRRRVFEDFASRPANFIDPLAELHLFGTGLPAPLEFVYPHSTNIIYPGSHPVDSDTFHLPEVITDRFDLPATGHKTSAKVREQVYYLSTKFRGDARIDDDEALSWQEVSSFLRPFCKTILYSHDPHVIVGRMSERIIDSIRKSKISAYFVASQDDILEAERPTNFFEFYQIKTAACDLCLDNKQFLEPDLISVSSLSLRSTQTFKKLLEAKSREMVSYLRLRDWSEYRICRKCFSRYFPTRVWRD